MEKLEFKPELELDDLEVAALALLVGHSGYKVLHKIVQYEFSNFVSAHINTPTGSDATIIEGHRVIKTAAQLYDGATRRVRLIVDSYYTDNKKDTTAPVDLTEGVIDIGPQASTQDDLDGFEESL